MILQNKIKNPSAWETLTDGKIVWEKNTKKSAEGGDKKPLSATMQFTLNTGSNTVVFTGSCGGGKRERERERERERVTMCLCVYVIVST